VKWSPVKQGNNSLINNDDPVKSLKYSLSLDGRGRGEGGKSRNSNMLFSPSPSSPPARGGEFLLFTNSSIMDTPTSSRLGSRLISER